MDEIRERWNKLGDEMQEKENSVTEIFSRDRSALLLARLNRKMKLGLIWNIVLMLLPVVAGVYHRQSTEMLWLLGGFFLMMLVNLLYSGNHYLTVRRSAFMQENSCRMLERYLKAVKGTFRFERVWSLFTIPLSLIMAILYTQLLRYDSFAEIRPESPVLIVTALLMVTAVPAAILWTGWSQRKAYGEEIRELREMIAMLSAPD